MLFYILNQTDTLPQHSVSLSVDPQGQNNFHINAKMIFMLTSNEYTFFFFSFFFGCVGSSLLRVGFLQLWQVGASHCSGFSCCRAQALGAWASVAAAHGLSSCSSRALERRLSSCGARAQLLHHTCYLPGPGIKPVSPALAGGFLTTAPPGNSRVHHFYLQMNQYITF